MNTRQLHLLDLMCCQGGATKGYQQAGFHVTGVDIEPQPYYCGNVFIQGDAFEWLTRNLSQFDLIHVSPKCQAHSVLTPKEYKGNHEVQLPRVLELLRSQPVPFIVENVAGTKQYMKNPLMLCGSMFGLEIFRHRYFELGNMGCPLIFHPPCQHNFVPILLSGTTTRKQDGERMHESRKAEKMTASGIDWMTVAGLDQAIPPAYTQFLGNAVKAYL